MAKKKKSAWKKPEVKPLTVSMPSTCNEPWFRNAVWEDQCQKAGTVYSTLPPPSCTGGKTALS